MQLKCSLNSPKKATTWLKFPQLTKPENMGKPKLKRFKSGIEIFSTIFRGLLDADTIRKC